MNASDTDLYLEQTRIAKRGAPWLIGFVVLATAIYSLVDIYDPNTGGLFFISAIVVWVLGYILLVVLMRISGGADEVHSGGIAGYFGLGILTGIPIGIGLILLIVPGLYLLMRWLPAYARLQDTGEGVNDAMSWSWANTRPHQISLSIALLGPVSCYLGLFAVGFWQEMHWQNLSEPMFNAAIVAGNFFVTMSTAWLQILGVAAYRLILGHQATPVGVFE